MYRVRGFLCVKLKQRKILPRLPEAYHPEASRRAHEEKTRPCYAVGAKKGLICKAFRARFSWGKGFIPTPAKSAFYCVTHNQNCTYEKTGRGGYLIAAVSRLFSFAVIYFPVCTIYSRQLLPVRLAALCSECSKHTGKQRYYLKAHYYRGNVPNKAIIPDAIRLPLVPTAKSLRIRKDFLIMPSSSLFSTALIVSSIIAFTFSEFSLNVS